MHGLYLLLCPSEPWSDFAAGQPNNYDGNQACAALVTQHTPDKLGDEGCYKLFPYICHDISKITHHIIPADTSSL